MTDKHSIKLFIYKHLMMKVSLAFLCVKVYFNGQQGTYILMVS